VEINWPALTMFDRATMKRIISIIKDSDEYGTPKEGAMRIAIDKVSKRIINEITSTW
jgi:hypothetical protein